MMRSSIFLVVMAGGSGTRFWPKSTSKRPKQLLSLGDPQHRTLLQQTIDRFETLVLPSHRYVVTTRSLQTAVEAESLGAQVLAEPEGRNTAPCIYWAARAIAERDPNGVILVMPSDHAISKVQSFLSTVERAVQHAASTDDLVTLGVRPTRAETGYGYLQLGAELGGDGSGCRRVKAFVEKPDAVRAKQFLNSGEYLWNGGMFVWKASSVLKAFDEHMPEMRRAWEEAKGVVGLAYPKMTSTSVDYGVMEKAKNVVTFPLDCGWDDLGSWTSLENLPKEILAQDSKGTVLEGQVISVDAGGWIVDAPGKVVALLGVDDLIVVESGQCILVAHKSRAQDIRKVVEAVKARRPELT